MYNLASILFLFPWFDLLLPSHIRKINLEQQRLSWEALFCPMILLGEDADPVASVCNDVSNVSIAASEKGGDWTCRIIGFFQLNWMGAFCSGNVLTFVFRKGLPSQRTRKHIPPQTWKVGICDRSQEGKKHPPIRYVTNKCQKMMQENMVSLASNMAMFGVFMVNFRWVKACRCLGVEFCKKILTHHQWRIVRCVSKMPRLTTWYQILQGHTKDIWAMKKNVVV